MGFLNKMVNLPTALKKREKFKKDSINVTTNGFFYLKPVYSRELMPNQSTKVNMGMFSRLNSMRNPAYARCKFVNRAFAVRYNSIFKSFDRFVSQEVDERGQSVTGLPYLYKATIYNFFYYDCVAHGGPGLFASEVESGQPYDIEYIQDNVDDDQVVQSLIKFTKRGKVAFDILINLGYNPPLVYCTPVEGGRYGVKDWNVKMSVMPLLAFLRVWFDWFRNNKYQPVLTYLNQTWYAEEFFNLEADADLEYDQLGAILCFLTQVSYDVDYFTCASKNPVTPSINEAVQTIKDVTVPNLATSVKSESTSGVVAGQNTPLVRRDDGSNFSGVLTQYILQALNKMTDYMQRDGLVGGKTLDRLLAHYGVRVPSLLLQRSVYLGKYEQAITIMDVTQTAPTENSPLGYQGGRGMTTEQASGSFEFETGKEDFCHILIISQLVPEISYFQGVKREMLHLSRFDFFTPEYDSLGVQSMSCSELYNGYSDYGATWYSELEEKQTWNKTFGFVPRYAEYKQSDNQDVLSGDFRISTAGRETLKSYQQFRNIIPNQTFTNNVMQTEKRFDEVGADVSQYDRIFNDASNFDDNFITFYNFEVVDYMPCRQLFESYDFGDDEEHNKRITIAKNGTMF